MDVVRIGMPARPRTGEAKLKAARVKAARANVMWTEIEPDDLIERDGGRLFVSAGSDLIYSLEPGAIFEKGTARLVSDFAELCFVVRDNDELVVFQRRPGTWTQVIEARERRRRRVAS